MPIVEWNNLFLMGMKQFDDDHKHLVNLLNKTYDAFIRNEPKINLVLVVDELVDYAANHFADEEHWMRATAYPALDMHVFQHDIFTKRIVAFQKSYHKGASSLSLELLTFLKEWLADHILVSDKEFGYFIASMGGYEQLSKTVGDRGGVRPRT